MFSSIISDGYEGTLDGTNQNDILYAVMKREVAEVEEPEESEAERPQANPQALQKT